jgi:hypothetical protein
MKKTSARTGRKSSQQLPARRGSRKSVDLAEIRERIANLVSEEAGRMVESAIEEAHQGHFGAMKYLFEIVGLYPAGDAEGGHAENSLAKTLLHRLGLPEEPQLENQVTKDSEPSPTGKQGNALE